MSLPVTGQCARVLIFCLLYTSVKEWYGWHFPELAKLVPDNYSFAKLVLFIKDKASLNEDSLHDLAALLNDDSGIAQRVIDNARISMGQDLSETDMENVCIFAQRVASLADYRRQLYLSLIHI